MRFLGDMNIPSGVVQWLRDQGHDAAHLREQNLKRLPNGQIFHKADAEGRIILTSALPRMVWAHRLLLQAYTPSNSS